MNEAEYKYPERVNLEKKINYLERIITKPLDYKSELFHVQDQSGEWMLFTLSFSAYGLTNVALKDSTFRPRAIKIIAEAINKAMMKDVYKFYSDIEEDSLHPVTSNRSVIYLGHLNMMTGCYRLLTDDGRFNALNDSISESLYTCFNHSKTKCLESYSRSIWIPDNTVALASLKLYGVKNKKPEYETLCKSWVNFAKKNFMDKKTNLLCTSIDYDTGKITEEPRGSMIGWSIFFISYFDKNFARQLYENYTHYFSNDILMLKLFRERAGIYTTGEGDIDSGPLFLGYGIPATAWAFGNAVLFSDLKTAKKLERVINIGSNEIETVNEIRYDIRFTDVSMSPLNDALLLYLETVYVFTPASSV